MEDASQYGEMVSNAVVSLFIIFSLICFVSKLLTNITTKFSILLGLLYRFTGRQEVSSF